nr:MAG TPA: hypothetical protein [Caudoviricetes sp.]
MIENSINKISKPNEMVDFFSLRKNPPSLQVLIIYFCMVD